MELARKTHNDLRLSISGLHMLFSSLGGDSVGPKYGDCDIDYFRDSIKHQRVSLSRLGPNYTASKPQHRS